MKQWVSIRDVEHLWKKRFGLLQTPLEQVKILLQTPEDWVEEDSRYYHKLFPQYTIVIEDEENDDGLSKEGNKMFYHHVQSDTSAYYGVIKIYHYSTQLFSCQSTDLDGHRMTAPCPESEFIHYRNYGDPKIHLKYYVVQRTLYETDHDYLRWLSDIKNTKQSYRLIIIGHSLDVTDKDIIYDLFDNANEIIVLYHNSEAKASYISNLVRLFGREAFETLKRDKSLTFLSLDANMTDLAAKMEKEAFEHVITETERVIV